MVEAVSVELIAFALKEGTNTINHSSRLGSLSHLRLPQIIFHLVPFQLPLTASTASELLNSKQHSLPQVPS